MDLSQCWSLLEREQWPVRQAPRETEYFLSFFPFMLRTTADSTLAAQLQRDEVNPTAKPALTVPTCFLVATAASLAPIYLNLYSHPPCPCFLGPPLVVQVGSCDLLKKASACDLAYDSREDESCCLRKGSIRRLVDLMMDIASAAECEAKLRGEDGSRSTDAVIAQSWNAGLQQKSDEVSFRTPMHMQQPARSRPLLRTSRVLSKLRVRDHRLGTLARDRVRRGSTLARDRERRSRAFADRGRGGVRRFRVIPGRRRTGIRSAGGFRRYVAESHV